MQPVLLQRYHPFDIFSFAQHRQAAGERVVLIIIESVSGASVRPVWTPMVVTQSGEYAGYVSNGCVDADIAQHALQVLSEGTVRRVRYGEGSPYMDIKLPCGGGVSLVLIPDPDADIIQTICERLEARRHIAVDFSEGVSLSDSVSGSSVPPKDGYVSYAPPLRILIAGRGENLVMCVRAALSLGIECRAFSPQPQDISQIQAVGGHAEQLAFGAAPDWQLDARCAVVTLFHDHAYELPLLISALQSEAFYIGAMGSKAAHKQRLDALSQQAAELELSRIHGPIGLVPSMRDAGRLAVSVLAEIIAQEGAPF